VCTSVTSDCEYGLQVRARILKMHGDSHANVAGRIPGLDAMLCVSLGRAVPSTQSASAASRSVTILSGQSNGACAAHGELLLHSTPLSARRSGDGPASPDSSELIATRRPQQLGSLAAWQTFLLVLAVSVGSLVAATDGEVISAVHDRLHQGRHKGWIRIAVEENGGTPPMPDGPWWAWV
jgi:hypothetical protein